MIPWYKSNGFTLLWQAAVLNTLMWALSSLQSNTWDFRTWGIAILSNFLIIVKDWFSPTVVAPFNFMNKSNGTTAPPQG